MKKSKNKELEIAVTRTWPLKRLKSVSVNREDGYVSDSILLSGDQARQLYDALGKILGEEDS